jgi:hypothetical protein
MFLGTSVRENIQNFSFMTEKQKKSGLSPVGRGKKVNKGKFYKMVGILQLVYGTAAHEMAFTRKNSDLLATPPWTHFCWKRVTSGDILGTSIDICLGREKIMNDTSSDK